MEGEPQRPAVAAAATGEAGTPAPSGVLRLRGLPFAAGEADIQEFFKAFELKHVFICKRNGRSTGEAYVQLANPAASSDALQQLNKQHMGHRYIEIFEASEADLNTAKTLSMDRLRGFVIRMRGLPYSASASDVLRFFNGIEVVRGMEGVVFTYTPDGRPTGEAFVEVQDEQGQREAMKRHKEMMGNRYIELFTSTKADFMQAIQHNRLILGYANRKRWLGPPGSMQQGQLLYTHPAPAGSQVHLAAPAVSYMASNVDDVSDLFSGMNLSHQGVQVLQQNVPQGGQGGYHHLNVAADGNPRLNQPNIRPGGPAGPRFCPGGEPGGSRQPHVGRMGPMQGRGGYRPPAGQQVPVQTYNIPGASANQTVLLQQPYIIQQHQGMQYEPAGYAPVTLGVPQQEQYFNQPGASMQGLTGLAGHAGSYLAPGPTYTLVQLPSGATGLQELPQLGSGLDMGQMRLANQLQTFEMPMSQLPGTSLPAGDVVLSSGSQKQGAQLDGSGNILLPQ